jgi:hypothetical protein
MVQCFHPPMGSVPTLHISYHLNEHYNSVRRGDDEGHRGIPPIIEYPIGHDLEKVKELMKGKPIIQEEEKGDDVFEYIKDDFENHLILKKALQLVFKPGKKIKKEDIDKNLKRI